MSSPSVDSISASFSMNTKTDSFARGSALIFSVLQKGDDFRIDITKSLAYPRCLGSWMISCISEIMSDTPCDVSDVPFEGVGLASERYISDEANGIAVSFFSGSLTMEEMLGGIILGDVYGAVDANGECVYCPTGAEYCCGPLDGAPTLSGE